jgi:hypothetical protein
MPFCPKCRDEFVERVALCPDCHVALVDSLQPVSKPGPRNNQSANRDSIVTIASSLHPEEAYILSQKLKAEGVQSFVADEHMAGLFGLPPMSTKGARVQVFKSDVAVARQILGLP